MGVARIVLTVILMLISIILIIVVLLQPGRYAGLTGAITGGAETFFGKKKAKSYEGKLATLTKISVAVFVVLSIALVIIE